MYISCCERCARSPEAAIPLLGETRTRRSRARRAPSPNALSPAAQYAVTRGDTLLRRSGRPLHLQHPDSPPVTDDSLFDIASVTKVVAGAAMAMLLFEDGNLHLDQPLAEIVPEFVGRQPRPAPPPDHLAHAAGAFLRPARLCSPVRACAHARKSLLRLLYAVPLEADPLARAEYSDLGFMLLGEALARRAGEPIDRFVQRPHPQAARHGGYGLRPTARTARALCSYRFRQRLSPPLAAGRSARRARLSTGRGFRACRSLLYRNRSEPFRALHAARRRSVVLAGRRRPLYPPRIAAREQLRALWDGTRLRRPRSPGVISPPAPTGTWALPAASLVDRSRRRSLDRAAHQPGLARPQFAENQSRCAPHFTMRCAKNSGLL